MDINEQVVSPYTYIGLEQHKVWMGEQSLHIFEYHSPFGHTERYGFVVVHNTYQNRDYVLSYAFNTQDYVYAHCIPLELFRLANELLTDNDR